MPLPVSHQEVDALMNLRLGAGGATIVTLAWNYSVASVWFLTSNIGTERAK